MGAAWAPGRSPSVFGSSARSARMLAGAISAGPLCALILGGRVRGPAAPLARRPGGRGGHRTAVRLRPNPGPPLPFSHHVFPPVEAAQSGRPQRTPTRRDVPKNTTPNKEVIAAASASETSLGTPMARIGDSAAEGIESIGPSVALAAADRADVPSSASASRSSTDGVLVQEHRDIPQNAVATPRSASPAPSHPLPSRQSPTAGRPRPRTPPAGGAQARVESSTSGARRRFVQPAPCQLCYTFFAGTHTHTLACFHASVRCRLGVSCLNAIWRRPGLAAPAAKQKGAIFIATARVRLTL